MRVVSGIVALLLGIVALLGASGLQTLWAPPETLTATVPEEPVEAPLTVITAGIGEVDDDPVEFTITGEGYFNVMLGRARDVEAWVGDAAHNTVTGVTADVPGNESPRLEVEHADGEATVPNPRDSDLWVDVQVGKDRLEQRWSVPSDGEWALLVARNGSDPAPTDMTVTWTNRVGDSPWIVPLYVIGGLLVLVGLALLAWALLRRRRGTTGGTGTPGLRGRPSTGPGPASATAGPSGAGSGTASRVRHDSGAARGARGTQRTPVTRTARGLGAGVAVLALGLAGIAPAVATATVPSSPSAAGTASGEAGAEDEAYPVLADSQLERILGDVAETVAAGDSEQDADALKPRVAGSALEMRTLNYRNRKIDDSLQVPAPISASPVLSAVAESDPSFPRTALAVTEGEGNSTPQILVLRQDSAREQYRLVATAPMTPGAELPGGTLDQTGVQAIGPTSGTGLVMSPGAALLGLARYLNVPTHDFSERIVANPYLDALHEFQADQVESADDARVTLDRIIVPDSLITLRLADGSAIAVGGLDARTTARPREEGGTVIVDELAAEVGEGDRETGTGVRMTYREVVALHVPAAGASGDEARISLVGMTDELRTVDFLD